MHIKPSKTLAYLYYKCSKCKQFYEELRVSEAKKGGSLTCSFCGNTDTIKPVDCIEIVYKTMGDPTVVNVIHNMGYKKSDIMRVLQGIPKTTDQKQLIKLVLRRLVDEQIKTAST